MESQLRAYALAALSRQYPKTSLCRLAQRRMQTASRSASHLPSFCHQHQAPSPVERNRRLVHTQVTSSDEYGQLPQETYSTIFAPKDYSAKGQKNVGTGDASSGKQGKQFAILGAGISGLSTAVYLRSLFPTAEITIYEASNHCGGWIRSEPVVLEDGYVLFEQGPRALMPHRPNSLAALDLVSDMGLADCVTWKGKDDPVCRNRFIYYPDRLVKMPGGDQDIYEVLTSLMTEPIYKGLFKSIMHEVRAPPRGSHIVDEGITTFLERRFGSRDIANNIVSAIMHGVYGGNIDSLSARSVLNSLWEMEATEGSVLLGSIKSQLRPKEQQVEDLLSPSVEPSFQATLQELGRSYTLKNGMQHLPNVMKISLEYSPNTKLRMEEKVTHLEYDEKTDGILVSTNNQPPIRYDHCISALPAAALAGLTPHLPSLATIRSVHIMVVNLFYRDPNLLREYGFGYLIPRSIPAAQNPECALGVTFDSLIGVGSDVGTKVSVMLGGAYWDSFHYLPTKAEGIAMGKSLVKRHLGIDVEPAASMATLNRNCIPQYHIGHGIELAKANVALSSKFNGRLSVVGNSYEGVGVNDCILGANRLVNRIARDPEGKATGLDRHIFVKR